MSSVDLLGELAAAHETSSMTFAAPEFAESAVVPSPDACVRASVLSAYAGL